MTYADSRFPVGLNVGFVEAAALIFALIVAPDPVQVEECLQKQLLQLQLQQPECVAQPLHTGCLFPLLQQLVA